MPLLLALLALLAPRIAIVLLWAFTMWFDGLFTSSLWPILGFVFLPTSLLWYTVVLHWFGGVGAIPILGDIFDFAWKANLRNVALLERHLAAPARAKRADRFFVLLLICGVLVMALGLLALGTLLTRWVFRALAGA